MIVGNGGVGRNDVDDVRTAGVKSGGGGGNNGAACAGVIRTMVNCSYGLSPCPYTAMPAGSVILAVKSWPCQRPCAKVRERIRSR